MDPLDALRRHQEQISACEKYVAWRSRVPPKGPRADPGADGATELGFAKAIQKSQRWCRSSVSIDRGQ